MSRFEIEIGKIKRAVSIERIPGSGRDEFYRLEILGVSGPQLLTVEKRERSYAVLSLADTLYVVRQKKRSPRSVEFESNGKVVGAQITNSEGLTPMIGTLSKTGMASISELVTSNFPAKVISIKVSVGDSLKEGDTLLILEAMKMEAQIKAPKDSLVVAVFVKEGEMVPRNANLVRLKFG